MGRFKILSILGAVLFTLVSTACTNDTTSSSQQDNYSTLSREFQYNYMLLYFYYNDAAQYLDTPEYYVGKGDSEYSEYRIPWDYWDTYYLYAQMNDKFTRYVDPMRSAAYLNLLQNSETKMGTGITVSSTAQGEFIVESVIMNSPADKAGINKGDIITAIDKTVPGSLVIFNKLSSGKIGDNIVYTLKRDSSSLDVSLTLDEYFSPTAELSFRDSIPIIRIESFTPHTSSDSGTYGEVLEMLKATEKYSSIIVDLRDNGGGEGEQCMGIANQFLSKGDTTIGIISTSPDTINITQALDTSFTINDQDGIAKDRYVVILANENSASCSEIFISALTSNRNSPIVGSPTYGKGIGQMSVSTPAYAIASITAMRVINKDGQSYHKYGFEPDFAISDNSAALEKAVTLAKERSFKRTAGYGSTNRNFLAKQTGEDNMPGFYKILK